MTTSGLLWLICVLLPGGLAILITGVRAGRWLARRAVRSRRPHERTPVPNRKHSEADTNQSVDEYIGKEKDPGPGGKIPLPDDHASQCTGDTCWCRHY